jgi:hypothetical protein
MTDGTGPKWAEEYTLQRIAEGHHVHVGKPGVPAGSCRIDCPHPDHDGIEWEDAGAYFASRPIPDD